jgi:hypothetical protein
LFFRIGFLREVQWYPIRPDKRASSFSLRFVSNFQKYGFKLTHYRPFP